jgi:hypothetical protein
MSGARSFVLALLLLGPGCTYVATPPADVKDRRPIYQAIADALPRASLGWGDTPGVVEMAASVRKEPKPPEPEPLRCNERGFMIHYAAFRPHAQWIPYEALKQARYGWQPFPNALLAPLLIVPLQFVRAIVVVDLGQVPGLQERLLSEAERLERVGRELGLGSPWSHAQAIKNKLAEDAAEFGPGSLSIAFSYAVPVPAWLPAYGPARATAEAFAWVQAHPDEPVLPDE